MGKIDIRKCLYCPVKECFYNDKYNIEGIMKTGKTTIDERNCELKKTHKKPKTKAQNMAQKQRNYWD